MKKMTLATEDSIMMMIKCGMLKREFVQGPWRTRLWYGENRSNKNRGVYKPTLPLLEVSKPSTHLTIKMMQLICARL